MPPVRRRAKRFDVRSADGTSLAIWAEGTGPPLVMVHGSLCDHSRFDLLAAALSDDLTTFAMDRRGFGASGDAPGYALEREFEDVAAVVDAVAARTGGKVALWGHSYGAGCAMGAATLTGNVSHHRAALADNWRKRRQVFAVPHPDKVARERDVSRLPVRERQTDQGDAGCAGSLWWTLGTLEAGALVHLAQWWVAGQCASRGSAGYRS